jgi:hypothetical protein
MDNIEIAKTDKITKPKGGVSHSYYCSNVSQTIYFQIKLFGKRPALPLAAISTLLNQRSVK